MQPRGAAMHEFNFEQLGVAAVTIGILLYFLKLAIDKIEKHEGTIAVLHQEKVEILVKSIDSQNSAHTALERAMDLFTAGGG